METPREGHAIAPKHGLGEQVMQHPNKTAASIRSEWALCLRVTARDRTPDTLLHEKKKSLGQNKQDAIFFFKKE